MGNIKFSIKMLFKDKGQSLFYITSMILSTLTIFNVFNLVFNEDFTSKTASDSTILYTTTVSQSYIMFSTIAGIVMFVSLLFVYFANLYFISKKTKELAIATISGRSIYELAIIIIVQNIILASIGTMVGLVLGFATMPIINSIVYSSIGSEVNMFAFAKMGFVITLILIFLQFVVMVLVDMGYVYRKEIIALVKENSVMYERDNKKSKGSYWIYLILYLLPVFIFIVSIPLEDKVSLYTYLMFFALIGIYGMIRYVLPKFIMYLKEKKFTYHKEMLQALSNLDYSIRKANFLVLILTIVSTILVQFIVTYSEVPEIRSVTTVSYLVIIVLMSVTIIYKVLIEAINRKTSFKQMRLIGYTNKQINNIINKENIFFYVSIASISLLHIAIMLGLNYILGKLELGTGLLIIGSFVGIYIICYIVSLIGYKKVIFNYLKVEG